MRMSNNAFTLNEWESRHNGQVMNVFMKDLKYNLKNVTLELADFILSGAFEDEEERWEISNNIASDIEDIVKRKVNSDSNHITTKKLDASERLETLKRLEK